MEFCDRNCVILLTNTAMYALNDFTRGKHIWSAQLVELVYKFSEESIASASRLLKCHSNFFGVTYVTEPGKRAQLAWSIISFFFTLLEPALHYLPMDT